MTTLTPTEQQAVNKIANSRNGNSAYDIGYEQGVNAGVDFALSTLFEPRCVAFAVWCARNYEYMYEPIDSGVEIKDREYRRFWADNEGQEFTTSELYSIYNKQLNKQQDEKNKT